MTGASQAGATNADLYFGAQDNGSFSSIDAGAASPTWNNRDCCDASDMAAETNRVVYSVCCYSPGRGNRLFVRNQGMTGGGELNTYPAGNVLGFRYVNAIGRLRPGRLRFVDDFRRVRDNRCRGQSDCMDSTRRRDLAGQSPWRACRFERRHHHCPPHRGRG
jgi:hypothetical protein